MNSDNKDKTWNNEQKKGNLNEGFSGENIPDDYDPAKHKTETETDSEGNERTVKRARDANRTSDSEAETQSGSSDKSRENDDIEPGKIKGSEDQNYDPNRPGGK